MSLEESLLKRIRMLLDSRKHHEDAMRLIDDQLRKLADTKPDIVLPPLDTLSIGDVAEFIFVTYGNSAAHVRHLLDDVIKFGKVVGGKIPADTLAGCLQQDRRRFVRVGRNTYKLRPDYFDSIKHRARELSKRLRNITPRSKGGHS